MATSPLRAAAARRKASKGLSAATKAKYYSAAVNVSAGVKASKKYAKAAEKVARAGGGAIAAAKAGLAAYNKGRVTPAKRIGPGNGGGTGGAG